MADERQPVRRKGLTLVYTGDGKGKTTAALGLTLRAVGRGFRVLFLQFIKSPERVTGEQRAIRYLPGVEMHQLGEGFTWTKTPEVHREALRRGWALAKEKIHSGAYDLAVLDEINTALAIARFPVDDVLPLAEVLALIDNRPAHTHLVLTGRSAHPAIVERADLVTVMEPLKHYYDRGIPAVYGIEL
ncbi:cob(I)yrinic acid a,c-diamide adenosyltransferase [Calditerricola satsumensis]|uniref:Cob(I)alamin adenosyltransferase n=1 Tax=Calditerricola satsumensis TaxID=373054 RepID=A0A8J3BEL7_9BACI|nr:cob(I)yrinic acid a,c-diamide adenosyltransferase [Calditerricola satsumensis]GGK03086.1 cob(I)alamin adenosyltransferase [Calditerricola satsumensis]